MEKKTKETVEPARPNKAKAEAGVRQLAAWR